MKTRYTRFINEELNTQKFNEEYEEVRDLLEDFWALLQDKIEEFSEINSRNPNEILTYNDNIKQQRGKSQKIEPPIKGKQYKYETNTDKVIIVQIEDPGQEDQAQAKVKVISSKDPKIKVNTIYPAKWSRLTPVKQTTT